MKALKLITVSLFVLVSAAEVFAARHPASINHAAVQYGDLKQHSAVEMKTSKDVEFCPFKSGVGMHANTNPPTQDARQASRPVRGTGNM